MPSQSEMGKKFENLKIYLDDSMRTHVTMSAQGGNSILFTYPPNEEKEYLSELKKRYPHACYIDIGEMFVEYIDKIGIDDFIDFYKEHESDGEVFVSESDDEGTFYALVMERIDKSSEKSDFIFVIRTGSLYGTNLSNNKFLENEIIKKLKKPIVVMYPSTMDNSDLHNQKLKFLGFAPASMYRSFLID